VRLHQSVRGKCRQQTEFSSHGGRRNAPTIEQIDSLHSNLRDCETVEEATAASLKDELKKE
jgi:hypothetical protein